MTAISQAAVSAATRPIALLAVAHHVGEHRLLAPNLIDLEHPEYIRLFLGSFGSQRWIDSIHVDTQTDKAMSPGWVRTTVDGRLPFGVRVQLRFLAEATPLQAVSE
jgi:hypothetical protein